MYKYIAGIVLLLCLNTAHAQELNCTVKLGYDRITDANTQQFKTLEKALQDFVNNTRFTTRNIARNERIECSMFFSLSAFSDNNYTATLQIVSSRPVYNSSYTTPILNYNDKDISFRYNEGENLTYNPSTFDSNLISIVAFYANMIIGMDADTYSKEGGTPYYEVAQNITVVAQGGGYKGWSQGEGSNQNRYFFVNDILSNTFTPFRDALYDYHMGALDIMADDPKTAKTNVMAAVAELAALYKVRPNAFLTRIFFDAKSDEIASMFSGGPALDSKTLVETLNRISPLNAAKWSRIK